MSGFIESGDHMPRHTSDHMPDETVYLAPVDMSPIQRAFDRMHSAQHAWRVQNSDSCAGECIRLDIVRAVRAINICNRSSDDYMMIFGIGGPNPCRADPVVLPTWETFAR